MNDNGPGYFIAVVGVVAGIFIMGLLMTYTGVTPMADVKASKEACEKSLPRDQVCVIHFIPEGKSS